MARTDYAINLMSLSYSAGTDIACLRKFFPIVLQYYEEYALYNMAFNEINDDVKTQSPTIYIQDTEFPIAIRLLCFAITLGWIDLIPRVMSLIDYNNPVRDGMLERIASTYFSRPFPVLSTCTRNLPYSRTLDIFSAAPDERPALMRAYLRDWYKGSRREPYYDAHSRAVSFFGYWAWETAAITTALSIDDESYRSMEFYPSDLVKYFNDNASVFRNHSRAADEVRAKAGEPCPISGMWESIGTPTGSAIFEAGTPMPTLGSPYGSTVWRCVTSPPTSSYQDNREWAKPNDEQR